MNILRSLKAHDGAYVSVVACGAMVVLVASLLVTQGAGRADQLLHSALFVISLGGACVAIVNLRAQKRIKQAHDLAERARDTLLERFTLATEAGQVGIWELDIVAKTAVWDQKTYKQYGLDPTTASAAIGREHMDKYLHPDDKERFWESNRRAFSGEPYDIEFRMFRPDGEMRHLHSIASLVRDENGDAIRLVGTSRDVTEVRRLTEQLRAEKDRLLTTVKELAVANKIAEEASRAKSNFLASMSHELRTPLNAILGFSEMIKEEMLGPVSIAQYIGYARDIHNSGRHLLDLINDILDLSKLDAGKFELRMEDMEASALIPDCLSLVRDSAQKAGLSLTSSGAQTLPHIHADKRLLKQVLLNLLSNAIKFTPSGGGVTVTSDYDAQSGNLRIAVKDTGIGMSAVEVQTAMSPYGQIDSKIARGHHGTGLGLPISAALMKSHGGVLTIASVQGEGTTMTMDLTVQLVAKKANVA